MRNTNCRAAHLSDRDFEDLDSRQKALVRESIAEFKRNNPGKDAAVIDPTESWALAAEEMLADLTAHKEAVLKALKDEDAAVEVKAKVEKETAAKVEAAKPKPLPKFDNVPDLAEAVGREQNIPKPVVDAYLERQLGRSHAKIAKDFGVGASTVKDWIKKFTPLMEVALKDRLERGVSITEAAKRTEAAPDMEALGTDVGADALVEVNDDGEVEVADPKDETDENVNVSKSKYSKAETKAHDDSKARSEYLRALRGAKGLEAQFDALSTDAGVKVTWADLGEKGRVWFQEMASKGEALEGHIAVVEAHNEGLLNSLAFLKGKRASVASINAMVARWFPARDMSGLVHVHATTDAARAASKVFAKRDGSRTQAFVDQSDGTVHLIAEKIESGQELSVMLHEVGVHIGMGSNKSRIRGLSARVREWNRTGGAIEKGIAQIAQARVDAAHKARPLSADIRHEELVAYAVEEAVRRGYTPSADPADAANVRGWLHSVMEFFKAGIAKFFGESAPDIGLQDLVNLAYGSANLSAPLNARAGILESLSPDLAEFKGATLREKLTTGLGDAWRTTPSLLGWLSTEQLAERFKDIKVQVSEDAKPEQPVRMFSETMRRMSGRAAELANASDAVKKQWEATVKKFGPKAAADLNTLLQEGTDAQVWADVPMDHAKNKHVAKDADAHAAHEKLSAIYKGLPAEMKQVWVAVLKDLRDGWNAAVHGYQKSVVSMHVTDSLAGLGLTRDEVYAAARLRSPEARAKVLEGKNPAQVRVFEDLWKDLDAHHDEFDGRLPGPYFPKVRYGEHVVSFRSPAFMNAEAGLARAEAELGRAEATTAAVVDIDKDLERAKRYLKQATDKDKKASYRNMIADLEAQRELEMGPLEAQRALADAARSRLNDLKAQMDQYHVEFFESLADAKAREAQLKSVLGDKMVVKRSLRTAYLAEMDAASPAYVRRLEARLGKELSPADADKAAVAMRELRLQMMPGNSSGKARLKRLGVAGVKNEQTLRSFATASLRNAFAVSRLEYKDQLNEAVDMLRFGESDDGKIVGHELGLRLAMNSNMPTPSKWISAVSNYTYMAHLGFNVSFMAVQFTQPAVISAPILAGRHGMRAALGALKDAYPAVTAALLKSGKLDVDAAVKAGKMTADEGAMIQGMIDHGRIDTTVRHDLGTTSSGESETWISKLATMSGTPAHRIEMVNRVSTALAAYRLEVAMRTKHGEGGSVHGNASAYANQIVSETHLDYSPEVRARLMHPSTLGGFGRILWQFKSYQQGMVFLVMKNLVDSFRGDREAQKALAYLVGMQFATAGLTGLPFMGSAVLIATMLYKAFEDDDEERDLQHWLRQGLAGVGGDTFADLVTKGTPAALGLDMSKRIGLGDIGLLAPYANTSGKQPKDALAAFWFSLTGGPAGGIAANLSDALMKASEGKFVEAAIQASPTALRSVGQALKWSSEGITNSKGDVLLAADELNGAQLAAKAMSFQLTSVSNLQDKRSAYFEARNNRDDVRKGLLKEYSDARTSGGDVAAVREKVAEFNARHADEPKIRITASTLEKSLAAFRRADRERRSGVRVGKRDEGLANEMGL